MNKLYFANESIDRDMSYKRHNIFLNVGSLIRSSSIILILFSLKTVRPDGIFGN